jgi:BirA family biotin operon repressor/biotin-[acetyl-CoA-carboxylase] ligase
VVLTPVAAVSMGAAIEEVTGVQVGIKWPNDLVLNGKKICGILTEMSSEVERIHYIVVGLGVNANMVQMPEQINDKATSLFAETGKKVERAAVAASFLKHFEYNYELVAASHSLGGLKNQYEKMLVNIGKVVYIISSYGSYQATALGVDMQGALLVRTEDGEVRTVNSGEVSVRGIYGYV